MCRLAAWASRVPITLQTVLGPESLTRLSHLSTVHCHGWGASWIDPTGLQHVHRSPLAAFEDPEFDRFAHEVPATAALVHLRLGTPGYGSGLANVHPFTDGGWALAHNGAILPPTSIDGLMRPDSDRSPTSETDSERYFLALRDELDRNGGSLARAMDRLLERMSEVGLTSRSLNAVLLERATLRVVSCHDPDARLSAARVWPVGRDDAIWPSYFPLSYQEQPDLCATASSGIVDPGPGGVWQLLPNDVVWTVALSDLSASSAPITRRVDPPVELLRRSA